MAVYDDIIYKDIGTSSALSLRHRINVGLVFAVVFLVMALSHAGGLGIAPLAAIIGVSGYLNSKPTSVKSIPPWFWALSMFAGWAILSSMWSSYEDTQFLSNRVKLAIGCLLYPGLLIAFRSAGKYDMSLLRHMLIAMSILALCVLLIDLISGYAITYMVDPLAAGENAVRKGGDIEMNLGHHITVLALLMPGVMALMRQELTLGWMLAVIFAFFVAVAALFGQLMVGVFAVFFGLAVMFCARLAPQRTLRGVTWLGIASILLAPFMGFFVSQASPELKAQLPFSWEHRLEMWTYTSAKILESPLWGHGFDAVRTFDETFSSRGVDNWAVVSLHPHNAGLHIWAETGFIGTALACFALLTIGITVERFCAHSRLRAMAAAGTMAVAILLSSVTYGVWQEWWWAALFFAAAILHLLPEKFPVDK